MNPLYNPNNNMMSQLKAQAMQLKNSIVNPREQVQQLLNSGQMSQEWLNQNLGYAQQLANQLFK
jgi:hypothetical protein